MLPVDVDVHGVQPHAHFRARQIEGFATLPDGTRKWLVYIKDWDFAWQDAYRYTEPIALPRGTVVAMRYTYDNSAANRRNPDRPPQRVRWGQNSTDEMGDLWIQVVPRTPEDREALRADFAPKVMAEDAVGYEKMLEVDRANPRIHEAVAAIDLSLGRIDAAVGHLEAALRLNPQSVEAHYNLATALVRSGRHDEAADHFRRALQIQPDHVGAHVNLGVVLRSQRRFTEATDRVCGWRSQLDPRNAAAHTNLAGVLAAEDHLREAVAHYRQALESESRSARSACRSRLDSRDIVGRHDSRAGRCPETGRARRPIDEPAGCPRPRHTGRGAERGRPVRPGDRHAANCFGNRRTIERDRQRAPASRTPGARSKGYRAAGTVAVSRTSDSTITAEHAKVAEL